MLAGKKNRGKKPDTKDHVWYDSIYIKGSKQANLERQSTYLGLGGRRLKGNGEWLLEGIGFPLGVMKCSRISIDVCTTL